jgi:flagellin
MLQRMRELAVQAANDTNSATDRGYLQKEADALLAEINRVASQTEYNGQTVLDGSYQNKSIQVGTDAGQTVSFSVAGTSTAELGLQGTTANLVSTGFVVTYGGDANYIDTPTGSPIVEGDQIAFEGDFSDVYSIETINPSMGGELSVRLDRDTSRNVLGEEIFIVAPSSNSIDLVNNASGALASISSAIEQVSGQRAEYGALQNRLEYTVSNLMNVSEFTTAARSRIEDADFAAESARLAKAQVLQQTGTAMLAQANASSQLAISLIR